MEEKSELLKKWLSFIDLKSSKEALSLFDNLVELYNQPHRYYHGLPHIYACLKHLEKVSNQVNDLFCIEAAIWFHDIIYLPMKSNNEEQSSIYAGKCLRKLGVSKVVIDKVQNLILMTKHPSKPKTHDEKYLIDIDLSILGAANNVYNYYKEQIRQEFIHIPEEQYKIGRAQLLKSFLTCEYIYHSNYFRDTYEAQARRNITYELEVLRS